MLSSNSTLLVVLLCTVFVVATYGQADFSSIPWWGAEGVRSRVATLAPVAVTRNLVYSVYKDTIMARNWRQRGANASYSASLSGLASTLPVLSTGGVGSPDVVYFLHKDGRLYAYQDQAKNKTKTKWQSNFVCSAKQGQEKQVLTVDTAAGVLVARCSTSLALVSLATGRRLATIPGQELGSLNLPFAFPDSQTVATWKGNTINLWHANGKAAGGLIRSLAVPDKRFKINSVAAGVKYLVATGSASASIYIISTDGKTKVKFDFKLTSNVAKAFVVPRPTVYNGVLYAVVQGTASGPTQQVWSLVALNMASPFKPRVLFQRPVEPGTPPVQALTYSRKYIYVSQPAQPVYKFAGYNLKTGALGWNNIRWPQEWSTAGLAAVTHCCDQAFISSNTDTQGSAAQVTAFLMLARRSDGTSYPPVDPTKCYCSNEPAHNY